MKWDKRGVIFTPDKNFDWMVSHASIPVVDKVDDEIIRIYFGTRDQQGRSLPAYIDVAVENPQKLLHISEHPLLPLGKLGTFDDNGIMPSWIVNYNKKKYLYYIGWNPQVTVSYRLSIGLAISNDNGNTYQKYSEGPICDRSIDEPYFNTAPCVIVNGNIWKMWYVSCTGWEVIDGWPEPYYHVKYAESSDGIHWTKTSHVCIDYDSFTNAIGRPCVFIENDMYKMLYSYRNIVNYRTHPEQGYRLGYAESVDGIHWTRKDEDVGIAVSNSGWDSRMMEYCYRYNDYRNTYLFYNGNGFGKSGLGYAVLA
jgi:hypothetical protein